MLESHRLTRHLTQHLRLPQRATDSCSSQLKHRGAAVSPTAPQNQRCASPFALQDRRARSLKILRSPSHTGPLPRHPFKLM
ncbi:hypothetical protein QQF64_021643 [Cirrhinus molitorella]|uniref:Uncharacterized protein n=1 Tax=Cirrhinus molitorella TaxID=172907 RepID=A0ABR3L7M1_9TELE